MLITIEDGNVEISADVEMINFNHRVHNFKVLVYDDFRSDWSNVTKEYHLNRKYYDKAEALLIEEFEKQLRIAAGDSRDKFEDGEGPNNAA